MKNKLMEIIGNMKVRNNWGRAVKDYAIELLEFTEIDNDNFCNENLITKTLLNGASDWYRYSWGGCSLIYNVDIVKRFHNGIIPNKYLGKFGLKQPNPHESWLDVQTRALRQAHTLILNTWRILEIEGI